MSIKPMRSTGMTGQSSSRGTCVTPKTYLHIISNTIRYHNRLIHSKILPSFVNENELLSDDIHVLFLDKSDDRLVNYLQKANIHDTYQDACECIWSYSK